MAQKKDYGPFAQDIIDKVGGPDNIIMVTHCVTRLRFKLKDKSKADTQAIENTKGVIQVMDVPGQYQVVVGPKVYDVYDAVLKIPGIKGGGEVAADDGDDDGEQEKKSVLGIIIDLISGILAPVIGLLATSGMIKGILAFCTWLGVLDATSGTYLLWYAVGDAPMYFMPILLGITAARKFKMDEFVGASLGAALVYPTMVTMASGDPTGTVLSGTFLQMNIQSTFLGIPIIFPQSGYTSSIVPIILAVWVTSYVYRFFNKHIPNTVKLFLVPMLTLGIMGPVTFLVIGPIAALLTNIISGIFNAILAIPAVGGIIEGTLLGAVWQILVIFGFHWALIPIGIANMGLQGFDQVLPPQFGCTWAQIGVVLAIVLRTHDEDVRDTGIAAFITGIFGTTEPAIYGVTLPARKPFIISCVAGAIGGLFLGLMKTTMFTMGYSGLLGLTSFIDARTADQIASSTLPYQGITSMIYAAIASVGCFVIGFILCNIFYDPNKKAEEKAAA